MSKSLVNEFQTDLLTIILPVSLQLLETVSHLSLLQIEASRSPEIPRLRDHKILRLGRIVV